MRKNEPTRDPVPDAYPGDVFDDVTVYLLCAFKEEGIKVRLARTWNFNVNDDAWAFKRQEKKNGNLARLCPYCKARHQKKQAKQARARRRAQSTLRETR